MLLPPQATTIKTTSRIAYKLTHCGSCVYLAVAVADYLTGEDTHDSTDRVVAYGSDVSCNDISVDGASSRYFLEKFLCDYRYTHPDRSCGRLSQHSCLAKLFQLRSEQGVTLSSGG
jgi:hypothetical protein